VKWVKNSGGVGQPRYYFNASAANEGSIIGGQKWGPALTESLYGLLLNLVPVDSAGGDQGSSCYFPEQNWEIILPSVSVNNVQWSIDAPASNISEPLTLPWATYFPEIRYNCPDYIDSCSFLKITGPANICNLTQIYTYKSHKNKACGQPTVWSLPQGIQTISQTDSTISVKVLNFGRYVIYGKNILGCVPTEDSIVVIAASTTPPLNLGNDFQICPGNSRTLHAGSQFISYEWQDGSTDSLLNINQAGLYWVKVTDSCNNILRDTINISPAPPIPFSVGTDRIICANDTVHITASPGFQNYQWSPAYQVSSTTGQAIFVNPLVDTTYTVIGEITPGCFAYDTIRITVRNALPVNLGIDKSFCFGDSLILNAGNGFASYIWNTGANTQFITVRNQGTYSVIATAINNCKAYDTISILNVWPKPQLSLDKRPELCFGTTRSLDPGNFVSYLWNTGATTRTITINSVGSYAVLVSDSKGCIGTDSLKITTINPSPTGFLPVDTSICPYGNIVIKPEALFNAYVWNNGAIGPSLEIANAGTYWLQVTNSKGCVGIDSILVLPKECLKGFFIPTAFTPNNDGLNDFLKPIMLGNIKQYEFWIYNRWGQSVFYSKDPLKGWDGNYKGLKQDGNVFVWICAYQFEGEPVIKKRGTFTLIR
jgi:gliding motility-associated-like protein